jgi:excisionase family DNA binding protein
MENAQSKIFTKTEASDFLKVSVMTIGRKRNEGLLPFHKIGDRVVFTAGDIEAFLKNCEAPRIARDKIESVKKPTANRRGPIEVSRELRNSRK